MENKQGESRWEQEHQQFPWSWCCLFSNAPLSRETSCTTPHSFIRAGRALQSAAKTLGLSGLEKRGDLIAPCSSLRNGSGERGADLFPLVSSDRMHRNGSKLHQRRFRLDMRKYFCTKSMVKHYNRLPREGVDTPACQCSRDIWTMPLTTCLWSALNCSGSWTR